MSSESRNRREREWTHDKGERLRGPIEIFLNITLYLREDIIHVKLVIATALMAIARKVIVFDFTEIGHQHVLASSTVVLALGITYWLISKREDQREPEKE